MSSLSANVARSHVFFTALHAQNATKKLYKTAIRAADTMLDTGLSMYDRLHNFAANYNPATLLFRTNFRVIPLSIEKILADYRKAKVTQEYNGILTCDPENHGILARSILKKIAPHLKNASEWNCEVRVVTSEIKKAVALPCGQIVLTEGLVKNVLFAEAVPINSTFDAKVNYTDLKEEDRVASVIAHTLAHSEMRHSLRKEEFLGLTASVLTISKLGFRVFKEKRPLDMKTALNTIVPIFKKWLIMTQMGKIYDRLLFGKNELAADSRCIELMTKAGFNPKGALWMMEFYAKTFPLPLNKVARALRLRGPLLSCPSRKERFNAMKESCFMKLASEQAP